MPEQVAKDQKRIGLGQVEHQRRIRHGAGVSARIESRAWID